jgi:hypothetical protein
MMTNVSCDVRKSSTNKKQIYPRNRLWRAIHMFPVRYKHHLHIKDKAIPVTSPEFYRCDSCEVRTSFIEIAVTAKQLRYET